jgi:hypothetical protein
VSDYVKLPAAERHAVLVEAGSRGARKRWGYPRTVRLTGLTEEQRVFVHELVRDLRKAAKEAA